MKEATSPSHDAADTTRSIITTLEIENQSHRRNEVIVLDSTNNQCLVTSQLNTPNSDDGNAMGLMFTVETAEDSVAIQTLEFYAEKTGQENSVEVTVYTKSGVFVGFEEQASEWTQIASTTVTLAAAGRATIIPEQAFQAIEVEPSSRQSFYVTLNTTGLQFSDIKDAGVSVGSPFVFDDFLSISTGVSSSDLFFINARHQRYPRLLNGAVFYSRQLNCMDAKTQASIEFNYTLETPSSGVVLAPISDIVGQTVKTLIGTNTTSSQYASNDMTTLDSVRSQAALVEGTCPNGWRSCFQLTTEVSISYMDFPTSGKIIYDVLDQQPKITAGLTQQGLSVEYNGATPLSYNYSFLLNGVPSNANLDDVEIAYFERVTLQFLQEALQNVTAATVLAVEVNNQESNSAAASTGQRRLRERCIQQSTPPTGVLQVFATIFGMDQLPEELTPLDQALAYVLDKNSEDLTYDLSSEILQPGTISQGGEGDVFVQLFSVRAQSSAAQNQTGLLGPISFSPPSANNNGKIIGIPAIWFAVLCIGIIFLMITWLAYMYARAKRENRQWRRLATREERRKRRKKAGPCREESEDFGSDDGLLKADKGYATEWTAAESFDTNPSYDISPVKWETGTKSTTGVQRSRESTSGEEGQELTHQNASKTTLPVPAEDVESTQEVPSALLPVSYSPSGRHKESNRDPTLQNDLHWNQFKLEKGKMCTNAAEQSSRIVESDALSRESKERLSAQATSKSSQTLSHKEESIPKPGTSKFESSLAVPAAPVDQYQTQSALAVENSPKRSKSKKKGHKSSRKEKIQREMSSLTTGSCDTTDKPEITASSPLESFPPNEATSTSTTDNASDNLERVDKAVPINLVAEKEMKQSPNKADGEVTSHSRSSTTRKKSKSKSPVRSAVIKGTGDDAKIDRTASQQLPTCDEEEPSELEKVKARVTRTPPLAPVNKTAPPKTSSVAKSDNIKEEPSEPDKIRACVISTKASPKSVHVEDVPKGSFLKAKEMFDRKKQATPVKPDPPTPLPLAVNDSKDTFTVELLAALQSSTDLKMMQDRLSKIYIPIGREKDLLDVILVCCARELSYEKRYGQLAEHLTTTLQLRWKRTLDQGFTDVLQNIARFTLLKNISSRNTPVRNVAKFFAHLLHAECIPWSVLRSLHEEQQGNGSSSSKATAESRVFVKTLVQQVAKAQRKDGETDDDVSRDGTTSSQSETNSNQAADEEHSLHMDNARAA